MRTSPRASPHLLKLWESPPHTSTSTNEKPGSLCPQPTPPLTLQPELQRRLRGAARAPSPAPPAPSRPASPAPTCREPVAGTPETRSARDCGRPRRQLLTSPIPSFIQLRRSAVPSGSRGAGVRGDTAGAGRGEPRAASPAGGEAGSRRGSREGTRSRAEPPGGLALAANVPLFMWLAPPLPTCT